VVIEAQSAGRAVLKQLEAASRPAETGQQMGNNQSNHQLTKQEKPATLFPATGRRTRTS